MKKIKKILALVTALGICMSFAACGDSAEDDEPAESTASAAETTAAAEDKSEEPAETTTTTATVAEAPETTTTTAEPEPEPETGSSYYANMAAEYEAHGASGTLLEVSIDGYMSGGIPAYKDGKFSFLLNDDNNDHYTFKMITFDLNSKEIVNTYDYGYLDSGTSTRILCGDKTLIMAPNDNKDPNDNMIKIIDIFSGKLDHTRYLNEIDLANGMLLNIDGRGYYYYTLDRIDEEVWNIPPAPFPSNQDFSFEKKSLKYKYFYSYGNKLYFYAYYDKGRNKDKDYYLFSYDLDKESYTELPYESKEAINASNFKAVGKYLQLETGDIYNMETDQYLGKIPDGKYYYFGGDHHIDYDRHKNKNIIFKYEPIDGEETSELIYEPTDEKVKLVPVNDTYFLYIDTAGIFLRTYEAPDKNDATVYLFK